MSDEATVERVARVIYEAEPNVFAAGMRRKPVPWDELAPYFKISARDVARAAISAMGETERLRNIVLMPRDLDEARAIVLLSEGTLQGAVAIAAMGAALPPQVSPELIEKLGKLATYLTEQGEYEACDLIDTVVERVTPKAKG